MSVSWAGYRSARRRSRQAWVVLGVAAASVVTATVWFFTAGQFLAAEPAVSGPSEAPVFDAAWMKPVTPPYPVPRGGAAAALEALPVKGRASGGDYDRSAFGQAWQDADHNGCDTRNDILRRDLHDVAFTKGSKCKVAAGTMLEPYVGLVVRFVRGADSSKDVQIDHVVALGDAWQKGARQLTAQARQNLANDPLNLIAADGDANQEKSASDAAAWLPKNKALRCHYVARQVSVKAAYGLWVTQPEKDAIARVLDSCPEQQTVVPR